MSIPTNVDKIHSDIIRKRENHIAMLKRQRENLDEMITTEEEYLIAYKKVIPTVIPLQEYSEEVKI